MRLTAIAIMLSTFITAGEVLSADWPQFRGPTGQGHSEATGLPLSWSETQNVAWNTPVVGRGWSSPVVLGDQVWMTTALETPATAEESKQMLGNVFVPNYDTAIGG